MLRGELASEAEWLRANLRVMVDGVTANDHDTDQFLTVSILRMAMELDLRGLDSLAASKWRRTLRSLRVVDVRALSEDMKRIKISFLRGLEGSEQVLFPEFKRRVAPVLAYKWAIAEVGELWGRSDAILQWLSFDERLLLTTNEKRLWPEVLDYLENEWSLANQSDLDPTVIEPVASILEGWLKDLGPNDPEFFSGFRFGPGAVAGTKGKPCALDKMRQLALTHPNNAAMECVEEYYSEMYPEVFPLLTEAELPDNGVLQGKVPDEWLYATNRILFVPKNALKHRIISAEPLWLSWVQQGIRRSLYAYIDRNFDSRLNLRDQTGSRKLAQRGSADGSYATVDKSNASDSVSVTLVRKLFRRTYVGEILLAARSTHALLPYDVLIELDKFAPMGSGTCFGVMSLILCAACEHAIRQTFGREGRSGDYAVYGDDVVIRSQAYPAYSRIATALGFSINMDKTFARAGAAHHYREACGIECIDGRDVTPLRYSRFQEPICGAAPVPRDASFLEGVVDLINRLYLKGLWHTRSATIALLYARSRTPNNGWLAHVWYHLKRVDYSDYLRGRNGPCCVVVPDGTATQWHCKKRWNAQLQRTEIYAFAYTSKEVETRDDGIAYILWFHRAYRRLRDHNPRYGVVPWLTPDYAGLSPVLAGAGDTCLRWRQSWIASE